MSKMHEEGLTATLPWGDKSPIGLMSGSFGVLAKGKIQTRCAHRDCRYRCETGIILAALQASRSFLDR